MVGNMCEQLVDLVVTLFLSLVLFVHLFISLPSMLLCYGKTEWEVPGVRVMGMCAFLLCLLGESSGKCLSAPLGRGHQVFML